MDPLSIATASLSLAAGIAKASLTLSQFSREFRDSAEDIDALSKEMQALAAVLNPLTRSLTHPHACPLPEVLVRQVDNTISGCIVVLTQIEETIQKYRRDSIWTSTKWVIFGKDDVLKLRGSLEAYTMALNIGLHAISLNTDQDIKDDTLVIRSHVEALKLNTDEILARVSTIRENGPSSHSRSRVEEWIEQMTVLGTYAESSYKETLVDPNELPPYQKSPSLALIKERTQVQVTKLEDRSFRTGPTPPALPDLSDFSEEVEAIASRVRGHEPMIKRSKAKRNTLTKSQRLQADEALQQGIQFGTAESIRNAIADGADINSLPNPEKVPQSLQRAIDVPDNEKLFELLRCGIDPDSKIAISAGFQGRSAIHYTILAYAVRALNEPAVWALHAAGAKVNLPRDDIHCPVCSHTGDILGKSCSTPLLTALTGRGSLTTALRIVRFLLAKGADPSDSGCTLDTIEHIFEDPPLSPLRAALAIYHRSKTLSFVELLIKSGAKGHFDRIYARQFSGREDNPFFDATGNVTLLRLIAPAVEKPSSELWKRALREQASSIEPEVFSVLMSEPYVQNDYLHLLIIDYLHYDKLSLASLSRAVGLFLKEGADPKVPAVCAYKKRGLFRAGSVTESLSAIELARNIRTKRERKDVIRLLEQRQK